MSNKVTRMREPRTYEKNSPHSYFADVARSTSPMFRDWSGAKARLERHGVELLGELRSNRSSSESRHILRTVANEIRSNDPNSQAEFRALTTGSGSGLAFVTPEYLVKEYRLYREYPPAFIEQLPHQDVPEYGLAVNIPAVEGAAGVVKQSSEGSGDQETDPTGGYLTANLGTFEGQVTISQQLLDRSGPGVVFDQVVYRQMRQEYDAAVDADSITTAIVATSQTITDSTAYASSTFIPNLYGDLHNASQKLLTAAGTKLRPTHHFFLPAPWMFVASQVGSDARPVILPNANPNADLALRFGEDDPVPGGYTGYNFAGVPAFVDGNIPLTSGNATILTINAGSLYPFCSNNPTVVSYVEPLASDLQVVVRLHGYAATLVLFPNGVCAISGAAYSPTPTFAG